MAYKGRFKPKNPSKYKGDPTRIIYRSLWEAKLMSFLDKEPGVIWWQSEEMFVRYKNPVTGKTSRYFPDFLVKKKNAEGVEEVIMIEVKPHKQTLEPDPSKKNATPTGRVSTRFLNEAKKYAVNDAKWTAARKYCAERGWKFQIFTEYELGLRKRKDG